MKTLKYMLVLLVGILFTAGCGGGTGTGGSSNPSDPTNLDGDAASVSFAIKATSGTLASNLVQALGLETSDGAGSDLTIESAWVNIRKIELKLPDGVRCADIDFALSDLATCETEDEVDEVDEDGEDESSSDESDDGEEGDEIELNGPFIFNLLTGESIPSLDSIEIPSGLFKEIEIEFDDLDQDDVLPEGVPATLVENTLIVDGTITLDGTPTPISIRLDFSEEVEFENLNGLEVSEVVFLNSILISLDVSSWLAGIDLGDCVDKGDVGLEGETVVVDEDSSSGSCSDIEDTIKDNIEASGTVDEDDDDDDEDDDDNSGS